MSIFTMLMTIPQVSDRYGSGSKLLGFRSYPGARILVSALLWFGFGIRKRSTENIYLACVGWIVLDVAVIVGVILYGSALVFRS